MRGDERDGHDRGAGQAAGADVRGRTVVSGGQRDLATCPAGAAGLGIRIRRGVPGLRWLVPVCEARYGELTSAQPVWVPIASRGVYLRAADPAGSIVFWTRQGTDILDHLQVHGVPAARSVTRLPWGINTYHP